MRDDVGTKTARERHEATYQQLCVLCAALAPFARWSALMLAQMAARDAPMRDADIVVKLDDVALTVADLRRAADAGGRNDN